MPDLAIVIVSYNARPYLERCLESLDQAPPETSHQILVIDNASDDGSAEVVARRWPRVTLVRQRHNAGFAAGVNVGFAQSAGELVLLLNSDTVVAPGAIDRLVADLRLHPEAAVVAPLLVDADGRPELSFGRMISPANELRQKLLARGHARRWPIIAAYVDRLMGREGTPDWVSGACLLVRRADAAAAGWFDERFVMYAEDVDFCARLRAAGRTIRFTPAVRIVHLRGRSAASAPAATARHYRRSQLAFYAKHHPRWLPWLKLYLAARGQLPSA